MRRWNYIMVVLLLLLLEKRSGAQVDPHFSQNYAYPLYLNPAFTGVIDGDYRATAIYKNQWLSKAAVPLFPAVSAPYFPIVLRPGRRA